MFIIHMGYIAILDTNIGGICMYVCNYSILLSFVFNKIVMYVQKMLLGPNQLAGQTVAGGGGGTY